MEQRSTPTENDSGWLDAVTVALILRRSARRILLVTLAAAVAAILLVLLLPKMYTARTTILPPKEAESSAAALSEHPNDVSAARLAAMKLMGDDTTPTSSFVAMLKSRTIQDRLIDRFDLLSVYRVPNRYQARSKLEHRTRIDTIQDGLIAVIVEDRDPSRAAQLANAYVEELRNLSQEIAFTEAHQRRSFYQQHMDGEREGLARAEADLKAEQEKSGLIQPALQNAAIIDAITDLRAQIAGAEVEVEAMRLYATPSNPDLRMAESRLSGLRGQLRKMQTDSDNAGNGNLEVATRRLPEAQLDFLRKSREVKYHELLYDFLVRQWEAARLDEVKSALLISVVDPAVPPETKSSPQRLLIIFLITATTLVVGCSVVLLKYEFQRTLANPPQRARIDRLRQQLRFSSPPSDDHP